MRKQGQNRTFLYQTQRRRELEGHNTTRIQTRHRKDIARRKGLASAAFKEYQKILTHKKTTINPKSEILRSIRNEHISISMRNLDTKRKKKSQNRRVPTPLPQKNCRHILPKNNHK